MTYDKKAWQKQYYQDNKERLDANNRAWAAAHDNVFRLQGLADYLRSAV